MVAALKVFVTLAVIVILLNRKLKMGNAMLAGSIVLFLLTGPELQKLTTAVTATVISWTTWEIIIALYFVMCLEYQLRTSGIIDGFMSVSRKIFKSDRFILAMMPAFLGFLPSLGGAIFSAPLVESASKPYNLDQETKTTINYWFRHIWEYTNPIFTGMLLASKLSDIPLGTLVSNMAWLTVLATLIGWLALITPLKNSLSTTAAADIVKPEEFDYRYLALAAGPILANLLLVVLFKLDASISMGLVVSAMIFILRQNIADIRAMFIHAFDQKLFWGVTGILFFQNILRQAGVVSDIAALLHDLSIPASVIVGIIAFTGGILTGTSQGFVAITFPFIAVLAPGDLTLVTACFAMGTAGHMLSPAHLCLLVTLDYFKSDFLKTLRPVFALEAVMVLVVYGYIGIWG
jgi:integral membrane protein (TIGR00529 family)